MAKMNKQKRGSSDVVTDVSLNITAVRWKDNKVVNAISTFNVKQPIQKVNRYCHREKAESKYWTTKHHEPTQYVHGRVDRMDQNI